MSEEKNILHCLHIPGEILEMIATGIEVEVIGLMKKSESRRNYYQMSKKRCPKNSL